MIRLYRSLAVAPLLAALACATVPQAGAPGMSTTNADLARSGYAAFARGDIPAVVALMSPTIVWHEMASLPYGGVYRGPDSVVQNVFAGLGRDWTPFSATPSEFIAAGNHVTVLGEYQGTHRTTGRSFVAPFAHVWRFENGRLAEFRQFTDTALWLVAAPAR